MRTIGAFALLTVLAGGSFAADAPESRWLFPKDSVRGYLDFQLAPPHNEVDPGICPVPDNPGPGQARCSGFSRYVWSGYLELQPLGRQMYRRFFIHMEAKVFGGDNIPQERYTASAAPIIWERTWGLGIDLPRGFELRVTQHSTALLGRYKSLQLPIWRLDGPYGMYTTAGVRWSFGGWARSGRQR